MCFFVPYADRNSKPLIAPEGGIECFKVVCLTDNPEVYSSLYQGFLYQKSKQCPEVPLVVEKGPFVIEEGYHSYCSLETCLMVPESRGWFSHTVIVRCLIPAGSQYYKNPARDEYVSSSIILLGKE